MIRKILIIIAVNILAACATTSVKEYQAPDGSKIKTVKCTSEQSKCFEMASSTCPDSGTYRVISSESHAGGLAADILPGPITWYSMTYSCGPSDGTMPDFKFTGQHYALPPPNSAPVVIKQKPTTTNCTTYGNTVSCNSY